MGVLGLAPFLLKACPDVIKTLPDRLQGLRGKKIVIDGTLLTQRLHFAPMPHKYRHVLGWYRVIKEFQESDVQAICVFDGPERSLAKQVEVERRRKVRRLGTVRSTFEAERSKRLMSLTKLSGQWSSLGPLAQEEVFSTLQALLSDWKLPSIAQLPPQLTGASREDPEDLAKHVGVPVSSSQDPDSAPFSRVLDDPPALDTNAANVPQNTMPSGDTSLARMPLDQLTLETRGLPFIDDDVSVSEGRSVDVATDTQLSFTSTLMAQYIQYQQSIPRLESFSAIHPSPARTEADGETGEEYVISKTQLQLTVEEGRFWEELSRSSTPGEAQSVMRNGIMTLAQKSSLMSESYERRTNPPTMETYEESKEILRAMGVPCIETDGPFEAEALASSLVLSGYADFVASEDSDVIIYEAPLIRNLSSRRDPLVLISGSEVRAGLQLARAEFVDFALLLGTDFSQRIKNVGPQRALKFIREHGSIERVLERERQYLPRVPQEAYLSQVARARLVFETLPPAPDVGLLERGKMDEDAVNTILRRYNLQREIPDDWEYQAALAGNYFKDDPAGS